VEKSPAWKPQAMFAEVTQGITSVSWTHLPRAERFADVAAEIDGLARAEG
jgi:hypothetical protein